MKARFADTTIISRLPTFFKGDLKTNLSYWGKYHQKVGKSSEKLFESKLNT